MKMKTLALAGLFGMAANAAVAAPEKYTIESSHTYPSFEAPHLDISWWRGKFNKTTGTVVLDRAAKTGSVDITVDINSVDFGHDLMNKHALGKDFFKADQYPTSTYKGKIVFTGDTPSAVEGDLTLLGVTKPLKLTINSFKCIQHPMLKKEDCGVDAHGEFNRADFGMTYGSQFSTQVKLAIQVEALKD